MNMNNVMRFPPILMITLFILGFVAVDCAEAQRGRKPPKGELKILKDLPDFFVNDNVMPKYLKQVYKKDATRLSLRLIAQEQRLSQQTIIVPEELVQSVYNALVAVRVSDYDHVKTIAEKFGIRSYPIPNVESIILVFEHDAAWVEPLKQRQDTTGSPSINRLIRQYNLIMTRMVYLDEERAGLVLQSMEPINIPALAIKFFTEEGIGSIEEVLPYGDGNDINIERTKEGWLITHSLRFGNCVNQCQKTHDWAFSVSESGEVSFLEETGDTIPPWISAPAQAKRYPDVLKD